ncbi:EAL domain-containing protein [Alteribacillus sp. JSM 102045]|uniref:EAL domain-containing protein n=1 Tax=Alteribacillus sp. JSM 102045 TaxID=1562101 RepID=UPI0035BF2932
MNDREANLAIVKTIIATADLKVIAEGIEEESQERELQLLQCHFFQGYYYSRPKKLLELHHFIQQG